MNEAVTLTKEQIEELCDPDSEGYFYSDRIERLSALRILALHGLETRFKPIIEAEIGKWYNFYDANGYAYTGEWAEIWRDNVDQWVKPFTQCTAVPKHPSVLKGQE